MPRQSPVRHLFHLRAVIEGISPSIVREIVIDRSADAGELARVLKAAFGLDECIRHGRADAAGTRISTS